MSETLQPSPESQRETGFYKYEWHEPCHHPDDISKGKSWISSDIGEDNIPILLLNIANILYENGYTKLKSQTLSHTHSNNMEISVEKQKDSLFPKIVFKNAKTGEESIVTFKKKTDGDKENITLAADGNEINSDDFSKYMQLYQFDAPLESAYYSLGFEDKVKSNKDFVNHAQLREQLIQKLQQGKEGDNGSDESSPA
jgi:hypothetical protein